MVMMSQKEFQRVKVIENAAPGTAAQAPLSTRLYRLGAAWQSRARHALGPLCSPEAFDPDLGAGQVSRLQRFSSAGIADRRTRLASARESNQSGRGGDGREARDRSCGMVFPAWV